MRPQGVGESGGGRGRDLASVYAAAAAATPDAPAVWYSDTEISYADLVGRAAAFATVLEGEGVGTGDRVMLLLQNTPVFPIAWLAAAQLGAVAVPVNPLYRERELERLLADARPVVVVAQDDAALAVSRLRPGLTLFTADAGDGRMRHDPHAIPATSSGALPGRSFGAVVKAALGRRPRPRTIDPASAALIVYTSGTTGEPKGVVISHANLHAAGCFYRDWAGLETGAPVLAAAPLFHVTGLTGALMAAAVCAAPVVLTDRFEPGVVLDAIAERRPRFTVCAMTALLALMNHPAFDRARFASLRAVFSGGAPTPPAVAARFEAATGLVLGAVYGLTETAGPVVASPLGRRPPVDPVFGALSVGVPAPGVEVQVVDDAGEPVRPGSAGELLVRGPSVFGAYFGRPRETAEALQDGWLRTGDIVTRDVEGWLYLVDRKKDVIVASGFKVWPREVEDVLLEHPAVLDAAVFGAPDAYRGETVKARVRLREGAQTPAEEIVTHCRTRLAAYKVPREVTFGEVPRVAAGKLDRRRLREEEARRAGGS